MVQHSAHYKLRSYQTKHNRSINQTTVLSQGSCLKELRALTALNNKREIQGCIFIVCPASPPGWDFHWIWGNKMKKKGKRGKRGKGEGEKGGRGKGKGERNGKMGSGKRKRGREKGQKGREKGEEGKDKGQEGREKGEGKKGRKKTTKTSKLKRNGIRNA